MDTFSKISKNINLATRFDSDNNEIEVERRIDEEQIVKKQEIIDLLIAAGYFRARIKGLSNFDKIVGGMVFCIEACDFEVDVDLLFHENLSIGQKIALTEKIVKVLPLMKFPSDLIEPHQIQGLDFISIFPVIQWLVKRSVENRAEKAERLKLFAVSQFHNHFSLESQASEKIKRDKVRENVKFLEEKYGVRRKYKRKNNEPMSEKARVRLTLLEYGNKSFLRMPGPLEGSKQSEKQSDDQDQLEQEEIDVEQLLSNLAVAKEESYQLDANLNLAQKQELAKHYENLKSEMIIDSKELSERNKIEALEATIQALEKKLSRVSAENELLESDINAEEKKYEQILIEKVDIKQQIEDFDELEKNDKDGVIAEIKKLILVNEELKVKEKNFKDQCKKELQELHLKIEASDSLTPDEDIKEYTELLAVETENLRLARLQLAKKNRAVILVQRQLDDIPDNIELAQYQRRFLELYNQVSAKHKETKQYFTLYNTLSDTKLYMEKEISFLNSIYDNYYQAMSNPVSKDQFVKKLEDIVEGVKSSKIKIKAKNDEEKARRDALNNHLSSLIEQQRTYHRTIKKFTLACERNKKLSNFLKSVQFE